MDLWQVLGNIIFSSTAEKQKLENIVWPEIKRLIDIDLEALKDVSGSNNSIVTVGGYTRGVIQCFAISPVKV